MKSERSSSSRFRSTRCWEPSKRLPLLPTDTSSSERAGECTLKEIWIKLHMEIQYRIILSNADKNAIIKRCCKFCNQEYTRTAYINRTLVKRHNPTSCKNLMACSQMEVIKMVCREKWTLMRIIKNIILQRLFIKIGSSPNKISKMRPTDNKLTQLT